MSLKIGLVYELLGSYARRPGDPPDVDAEYEPEETIEALEAAVRFEGHEPVRLGAPQALLAALGKGELPGVDAAWNIAEGMGSRNREAWAPVLLEMAGVPTLGSDALSLSLSLDKHWTRQVVAAAGVAVPRGWSIASVGDLEILFDSVTYPLFVKPRWEGTAKGIGPRSRVEDRASLVSAVEQVVADYRQPALVEAFLPGAEYTVTMVGNDPPRVLPVLQRALESRTGIGIHALERHAAPASGWQPITPGELSPELEATLGELALRCFEALECRDFARADFRLDAEGVPHFLEINPLPTFAPDASFGILAELADRPLASLLGAVLRAGLERLGLA
jgi:D-alanine-D-alanine ligase